MVAGMTYYQICCYFLIYSFAGWVLEVAFHAITLGKWVNRGFLNGPLCPVYGFGMLAVLAIYNTVSEQVPTADISLWKIFLFGALIATLVELIAGWLLDTVFHLRWWDYSRQWGNFHGYICPLFSVLWGAAIVVFVKYVHPLLVAGHFSASLPVPPHAWTILLIIYLLIFLDLIVSVAEAAGLSRRLKELDKLRKILRKPADLMSQGIADSTIKAAQTVETTQVKASLAKAELKDHAYDVVDAAWAKADSLKAAGQEKVGQAAQLTHEAAQNRYEAAHDKYNAAKARSEELYRQLLSKNPFGSGRLLHAFPSLQSDEYKDLLQDLKKRIAGILKGEEENSHE